MNTSASEKRGLVKEHFNYYFALMCARRPQVARCNTQHSRTLEFTDVEFEYVYRSSVHDYRKSGALHGCVVSPDVI